MSEVQEDQFFVEVKKEVLGKATELHKNEWNAINEIHISLTKPFALKHHEIDFFWGKLEEKLKSSTHIKPFNLCLDNYQFYNNDDKSTSFIALNASTESRGEIVRIINVVDEVMAMYGYPLYYANPTPHASIYWAKGRTEQNMPTNKSTPINLKVSEIKCKIGKRLHSFKL